MDRQHRNRHRHEDLTGGGRAGVRVRRGGGADGGAMEASRRGRFYHHDGPGAAAVPVVDQADCTAQMCRSCVAVTLADAIALGCCPCAVVSLLGLAFVKAPLALARRCLRRLRRRRGELRHKKRVRDVDGPAAKAKCRCSDAPPAATGRWRRWTPPTPRRKARGGLIKRFAAEPKRPKFHPETIG
ncbi:unnamed protein product [Miscanthus lutarioriparius]|uniref:Pollen preferential protein n=1 Tax=Miscanthus lutarioriparius TaxID=422564 RepID=A0A811NST6_9POAL|nr:unnamed protein product [Miscanthus lutarioriparius]